jgi:hypothetical protein
MVARSKSTGTNMTTKFILAFAVAAFALTGGSLAMPGNAFAKNGGNNAGSVHAMRVGNDSHRDRDHRNAHQHGHDHDHDHDRSYVYRHDHDHSRHLWHDTWWDYGVGPCWRWFDDYDEYVWVCD